ncbi:MULTISPECIES: NrsF family protein [unclassified Azospirillum]|uniref:NrsF family protein n=1 Tax=unclassified Azospirillum TaxID=2630922 RepID=UPI000B62574F|nr:MULTISPECIES: NrsF family protein [unclassified Azospirillum]SNS26424.1 hypothetical protein SAMN05880556_103225 [Azospirillum sp. RU38E]SNS44918.1 hypothetical protein SAMN05880591_103225 [Azospirillum sp. RU37A]
MTDTARLIDQLAARDDGVRRLPHPRWRLLRWLCLCLPLVLLMVGIEGVRPDLAAVIRQPLWLAQQGLALGTALAAAYAGITFSVPGREWWGKLVWLPILGFWVSAIWASLGPMGEAMAVTDFSEIFCPYCFPVISIGSACLLAWDMRRAAPIAPVRMMGLLLVAGGSLALFGERLIHDGFEAPLLMLVQILAILAAGPLLAPLGRAVFRWKRG